MQHMDTLLAIIEQATRQVDAIESLAAGLAAGMHAGVVDPDHFYTLLTTQMASVQASLTKLAIAAEKSRHTSLPGTHPTQHPALTRRAAGSNSG